MEWLEVKCKMAANFFFSTHNKSRVKDEIVTDARNYIADVSQPQRSQ
jgi:ribose 5-phosphate isomerase